MGWRKKEARSNPMSSSQSCLVVVVDDTGRNISWTVAYVLAL